MGCYDSIGVCETYSFRNGDTSKGWSIRLFGNHHS